MRAGLVLSLLTVTACLLPLAGTLGVPAVTLQSSLSTGAIGVFAIVAG